MSDTRRRYTVAQPVLRICMQLGLQPDRVFRRAGLSAEAFATEDPGLTTAQCFTLWEALAADAPTPEFPTGIARASAHGPFVPAAFAFSCSPTVRIGLTRLCEFKPLVGPVAMALRDTPAGPCLEVRSADPDVSLPPTFAVFEAVYLLELIRTATGVPVTPRALAIPAPERTAPLMADYLDAPPTAADALTVHLHPEDAARPLITEDAELLAHFEADLRRRLLKADQPHGLTARVRQALLTLLPAGTTGAEAVARRLGVSKRSLHRQLAAEATTFQRILDTTRHDLALHFLEQGEVAAEEISYLLGFKDPSSFYRAFRTWTGRTPAQARMAAQA